MKFLFASLLLLSGNDHDLEYRNTVSSVVMVTTYDGNWQPKHSTGVVIEGGDILTVCDNLREGMSVVTFPDFDKDGHVIGNIEHYLSDRNKLLPCRVIAADFEHNLALLRLVTPRYESKPMPLAARSPSPGQSIIAIGHQGPAAFGFAAGHVRQTIHCNHLEGHETPVKLLQTSTIANRGDIGVPIIRNGELVGINSFCISIETEYSTAVDVSEIRVFLEKPRPE